MNKRIILAAASIFALLHHTSNANNMGFLGNLVVRPIITAGLLKLGYETAKQRSFSPIKQTVTTAFPFSQSSKTGKIGLILHNTILSQPVFPDIAWDTLTNGEKTYPMDFDSKGLFNAFFS